MENPYRAARATLRERARARRSQRCRSTAIRTAARDGVKARAARRARRCRRASALMLGNGSDELIQIARPPRSRGPARVVLAPEPSFVMYRMNAIVRGHARYVGVPLARGLRARRRRDAGGDRARAAGARLPRLSEQPDRQPVRRARRSSAIIARGARPRRRSTRPTTRSPTRRFLPRVLEFPNLRRDAHACRRSAWPACGSATRSAHPDWIARVRQGAPALQRQRADAGRAPVAARARRRARASRPRRSARERARARGARWRRCPASTAFPTQANFVLVARARRRAHGSTACSDAGILVKNLARLRIRCSPTACASPSARRTRTTRCSHALDQRTRRCDVHERA